MAKLSTATPAAKAQADQLLKGAQAAGVAYSAVYRDVSRKGVRVKLYGLHNLTNAQRQALGDLGFTALPLSYHGGRSAVVYCTGQPLPTGPALAWPAPRTLAQRGATPKPKAKPACVCPHCGGALRIAKG